MVEEPPAAQTVLPNEATMKKEALIRVLVDRIKVTAKDVHDTGTGTLTLNQQELQDLLKTFIFSDPDALETAQHAGLVVPQLPSMLNVVIHGGNPSVEFLEKDGSHHIKFYARSTKFNLALGNATPKSFNVDEFGIKISNYQGPGINPGEQVGLTGISVIPKDMPVTDIPGAEILGFAAPESTIDRLIYWALKDNLIMTTMYNKTVPIIAANGPENETTTVMGMTANVAKDSLTLTYFRDKFTPLPNKFHLIFEAVKQIHGFSSQKK